jgi:hypothetical protein
MRFRATLLLVFPMIALAQTPKPADAPPEVDQALRSRVSAFLQFETEGNFRKAYDMVAEDSKDYYFAAPKEKATEYVIDAIEYSDNFTKASVSATGKRHMMLVGHPVDIPLVVVSRWRLEDGKWLWYHDPSKDSVPTLLGAIPANSGSDNDAPKSPLPKDLNPEAVAAAAQKIAVQQPTINKESLNFTMGVVATDQVVFHNNNMGQIKVLVDVVGGSKSVLVEPKESFVNAQADLTVKITYKPVKPKAGRALVRFTVEPFGSVYGLPVIVTAPPGANAPKP